MLTDGDCSVDEGGHGGNEDASLNSLNNKYSSSSAQQLSVIDV